MSTMMLPGSVENLHKATFEDLCVLTECIGDLAFGIGISLD